MKEVSCRVFDIIFRDLRKKKISPQILVEGTSYDVAHLRNKHERIEWSAYVRIMRNVERIYTMEELRGVGGAFFSNPLVRPFTLVGRLLFNARDFYLWVTTRKEGMGNQLFTCIETTSRAISPDRVIVDLSMPEGYEPCRAFFVITCGAFEAMPQLLALPPAKIAMTEHARGARYDIEIPPGGGALAGVRKAFSWPFMMRAVAHELKEANEVLTMRYEQLEQAQRLLDRQATQLKTAHSISRVIHAGLDLDKTLEAIAGALVEVARLSATELTLNADLEGHTLSRGASRGARTALQPIRAVIEARGRAVGELVLWPRTEAEVSEIRELLEYVVPTVTMAIDDALTFSAVVDYRDHLEQKVKDRTEELRQAHDRLARTVADLEQAQAVRDRIFANINHEIRTPLSLMTLATNDVRGRLGAKLDAKTAEQLKTVDENVGRLLGLVDDLLMLAAGQEGKLKLSPAPCDVAELLNRQLRGWFSVMEGAGLRLDYIGPPRAIALVDQNALQRAVSNLLSNALKFTPAGGQITVILEVRDREIEIAVRDTGVGIDEEFKTRIFGRFEQGRAPVRPGGRGSGIGLSIVKEIAGAHGGSVSAESNRGGGSIFRLTLPCEGCLETQPHGPSDVRLGAQLAPLATTPKPPELPDVLQPDAPVEATILIAEDDPQLLRALAELLAAKYRVVLAPDGLTALRLAREHRPDMLISDVGMPGMDGFELTRRFYELAGNHFAPVLLVTAYVDLGDRLSGFEAGAIDYILKPIHPDELLARVRSQLALRSTAFKLHESEKLASLGILSAGLAHEIRNPANALVNAIEPLRRQLPQEILDPESATGQLLEVLEDCAKQIGTLSRQLLGYVNRRDLLQTATTFEEVLSRALIISPATKHVTIKRAIAHGGPIMCAGAFLTQALGNLLENAAQAAGEGGWIEVSNRFEGAMLVIDVSDSGPGVPPQLRERIFEPFFTTKPPGVGTGLGLTTARQIIEQHGGTLRVLERPNGSVFRIELPYAGVETEGRERPARTPDRSASP
jgi:signal transduction histidine kinase